MKLTCGRHQTGPTRVSMAASFSPFFVKDQRLHFDSAKPSREPPKSLSLSLFSFLVSAQEDYDDGGRRSTAFFLPLNSSNRHLFSQNLRAPSSPSTEAAASSSSSSPALSLSHFPSSMSMPSGIHGQLLEVTVIGCNKLRDTEWLSKQDPYVRLEYGSTSYRTRTCTDGHKNPTFQEKFVFTLIEGLRELNAVVWNSNTLTNDDFIGSGKIQLQKVLSQGYDDSSWTLQTKSGRYAGEVKLILHYSNVKQVKNSTPGYAPPTVAPYSAPPMSYAPHYTSPPAAAAPYPSTSAYSPSLFPSYPPPPANYSAYAPNPYAPPPQTTAYPSQPYPSAPYPPQTYPPPPQASPYYPPRTYPPPY